MGYDRKIIQLSGFLLGYLLNVNRLEYFSRHVMVFHKTKVELFFPTPPNPTPNTHTHAHTHTHTLLRHPHPQTEAGSGSTLQSHPVPHATPTKYTHSSLSHEKKKFAAERE